MSNALEKKADKQQNRGAVHKVASNMNLVNLIVFLTLSLTILIFKEHLFVFWLAFIAKVISRRQNNLP